jgi:hypothetical protein
MNNKIKYYVDDTGGAFQLEAYQMQDLVDNGFIKGFVEVDKTEFTAHLTKQACLLDLRKPQAQRVW